MSNRKARQAEALLESGLRQLQQGLTEQARQAFEQALEIAPRHPDVLHLLGIAYFHQGRVADAIGCYERAIALRPADPETLYNAGVAYSQQGRAQEALASFERAIALRPAYPEAHCNLGAAYFHQGRTHDAIARYEKALALKPDFPEALYSLGLACSQLGRMQDAIARYEKALALRPAYPEASFSLGMAYLQVERMQDAIRCFEKALALRPDYLEACYNLGRVHHHHGSVQEAIACYEKTLALKPDFPEACFGLGMTYLQAERRQDAIRCFEQALALKPDYPEARCNLGRAHHHQGSIQEAIACYEKALALRPDYPEALLNLGNAWSIQQRGRDALACLEKALQLDPGYAHARMNYATELLMAGNLERGWECHDWRLKFVNPDLPAQVRDLAGADEHGRPAAGGQVLDWTAHARTPLWTGQPLAGKRLLVWAEQGVGDQILFASTYGEIVAAAAHCVIECNAKLIPLFARSFPGAQLVARTEPPHELTQGDLDYQIPAGSLPRWLRPTLASFPQRAGYLVPPPERVAYWRARLAALGPGPKVGFSWRSSNVAGLRGLACTTIEEWGAVFGTPGVHFVNLQYDECRAELDRAREQSGVALHAFPEVDLFNDLDEAAALTSACDLVISAPTAVSVLSAALGVTTWQLIYGPDWQEHGSGRNPWFPTLQSFMRAWDQPWDGILDGIAGRLRRYVAGAREEREGRVLHPETT